jgi:Na+/proline symporter
MANWFRLLSMTGAGEAIRGRIAVLLTTAQQITLLASLVAVQASHKKEDLYTILWMLVFGFATLNILGLVAKRLEPRQRRSAGFGEILAVLVVCTSVALLGWELLGIFHIFPIRLRQH